MPDNIADPAGEYSGPPWSRQPGEDETAHRAFMAYRDLGGKRTILGAAQAMNDAERADPAGRRKPHGGLTRWSKRWRWVERARLWDNFVQGEKDQAAAHYARVWEERRLALIDEAWDNADLLAARVKVMAGYPLVEKRKVSKDGKEITIIKPARWSASTMVEFIEKIQNLRRTSAQDAAGNLEDCTPEELDAIEAANADFKVAQMRAARQGRQEPPAEA